MNSDVSTIARRVRGQADALPDLFGRFDFDKAPERWAPEADAVSELGRVRSLDRSDYLGDPDLLARIREYTMLGDRTGDAYAALMRSEEHTSDLQSLMRSSYAVFRLRKKKKYNYTNATLITFTK